MSAAKAAQKIGRFEVVRRIGAGGQGTVFEARDPELDRPVAIKLIHCDQVAAGQTPLEGQLTARLHHPNIVSIYETGVIGTLPYLVFEYVTGVTLHTFIHRQQGHDLEEVCALMKQILDGVAHAHERGILHLDLTPSNILIDRDRVPRIMDFGLARWIGQKQPTSEHTIGSLRYMSPEHFDRNELGAHTDVFALSLIFAELLAGRPVLHGSTSTAVVQQLRAGTLELKSLTARRDMEPFVHVLRGGLERDSSARYADAGALRKALNAAMESANLPVAGAASHATVEYFLQAYAAQAGFSGSVALACGHQPPDLG